MKCCPQMSFFNGNGQIHVLDDMEVQVTMLRHEKSKTVKCANPVVSSLIHAFWGQYRVLVCVLFSASSFENVTFPHRKIEKSMHWFTGKATRTHRMCDEISGGVRDFRLSVSSL